MRAAALIVALAMSASALADEQRPAWFGQWMDEAAAEANRDAPSAAEIEGRPLIERPVWIERPDGGDFSEVVRILHPPTTPVRTVLDCLVLASARLRCRVAEFEADDVRAHVHPRFAMRLVPFFMIAEEIDNVPTAGSRVRIPITWLFGDEQTSDVH